MEKCKAYIAVIVIKCSFAGMMVSSKAAISSGMKPSVFVAYRQAFATVALLPLAFFFPSKGTSHLTRTGLCKIFFVSLYGLALSPNLNFAGFEFVSATIGAALSDIVLPSVFIISICLRVEKLGITKWHGVAKAAGTIVCLCGVMAFTFYKGPPLYSHAHHPLDVITQTKHDWVKGCLLCIASSILVALWQTLQVQLLKVYPERLRLTILQNGFSFLASSVYAAATERHLYSWKLGWNINLFSVAYSGIIVSGLMFWLQAWIIEKKGVIFNAVFGPLTLIVAAIYSAIFLQETLHWGSFLGCGLVVSGLYIFLWGSNLEAKIKAQEQPCHSIEGTDMEGKYQDKPIRQIRSWIFSLIYILK